jgi:hypothetical protein
MQEVENREDASFSSTATASVVVDTSLRFCPPGRVRFASLAAMTLHLTLLQSFPNPKPARVVRSTPDTKPTTFLANALATPPSSYPERMNNGRGKEFGRESEPLE